MSSTATEVLPVAALTAISVLHRTDVRERISHPEGCLPRELCERAASELANAQPDHEAPGLYEYVPNETCRDIMRYVLETHAAEVTAFKAEARPVTVNVARLRQIDWQRISGAHGALYFVVALTNLDPSTGWYTFLQANKAESTEQWETVKLEPGDAFVWRGECIGKPGEGEGGLMLVLMFR